jgi:hypothetical protein
VKEVAASVLPGRVRTLTFNLSQFDDAAELGDALHQVRDVSLTGLLPLVFWDEFDTALKGEPLGWLRHFLAPMQDGAFQEGQITHPIGPAVFVFAGGTSARLQDFGSSDTDGFRKAKGPDFASRLKGYVDVLGPNPRDENPVTDPYFLVRRAILLRTLLLLNAAHVFESSSGKQILQMDSGVLRAFLHTSRYRHGARSLESIVAMSTLFDRSRFERSCLPAEAQLGLHVDAAEFLDLVQRLELEGDVLESLAEAAHVVFCAGRLAEGASWGEQDTEYLRRHRLLKDFAERPVDPSKTQPALVSYDNLSEEEKEGNRALVRDIPNKLAAAGYAMRPARTGGGTARFTSEEQEHLAEQEHERWMREKLIAGWSYGPVRDDEVRSHPALLPWRKLTEEERIERYGVEWAPRVGDDELPEEEKEKDRELILGIGRILAVSGYTVVKVALPDSP